MDEKDGIAGAVAPPGVMDLQGMCDLGLRYVFGDGVDRSDDHAHVIWSDAARHGCAEAKTLCGVYRSFHGVDGAEDLYLSGAVGGSREGFFLLGLRNICRGKEKDSLRHGMDYVNDSGDSGYAMDEFLNSTCRDYSEYVENNGAFTEDLYMKVLGWFRLGPRERETHARSAVSGYPTRNMKRIRSLALKRAWLQEEAGKGAVRSQAMLGDAFAKEGDFREAARWWRIAAENDDREAMSHLADAYLYGRGVRKSVEEAVRWLNLAQSMGEPEAAFRLGMMYLNGEGIERSEPLAYGMFQLAASRGHGESCYLLGNRHFYGHGVQKCYGTAINYYQMAFDRHQGCRYMLGLMFSRSLGVRNRRKEGMRMMEQSVRKGFVPPDSVRRFTVTGICDVSKADLHVQTFSELVDENQALKRKVEEMSARILELERQLAGQ